MRAKVMLIASLVACTGKGTPGTGSGSTGSATPGSNAVPAGSATTGGATTTTSASAATGSAATGSAAGSAGSGAPPAADVLPSTPMTAEPVQSADDTTLGANIALTALGGTIVSPVEPKDRDPQWGAKNLLDGYPMIRGIEDIPNSFGWKPNDEVPKFPYELVIAFQAKREATLAEVVVDTASADNILGPAGLPKDIELWASTRSATDGFTQVASATLPQNAGENVIKLDHVHATYVKLVVKTSYDAGVRPQLGEVSIYEAADAPSIVADVPKNLLLPALGGSIARFSSQERQGEAYHLVDGFVDPQRGWCSGPNEAEHPVLFPHEISFAFRDHRTANIDRIVISPKSGQLYVTPTTDTWAKTIEVQTSETSPWDGFTTLKTLTVGTDGNPITVPVGKPIRYIRLRILDNHGNPRTTLGEVEAFEAPGKSLVAGRAVPLLGLAASSLAAGGETASRREKEPNNSVAEGDHLTTPDPVGGALTPAGDRDVFIVPAAAKAGKQTVTVSVEGRPAIRSRISVVDAGGVTRYTLDPAVLAAPTTKFSVVTDAGDVALQVVQPPAAQVVIWDSSGSMVDRVKDLDTALHAYMNQLAPTDRVQLIRFDDSIEVLMKSFSSDKTALTAALKDKVYADGGTSIYDAIGKGIDSLDKIDGSRALLLLTDGEDTTSQTDPSVFWRRLKQANARLYAIGLGNGLRDYVVRAGATAERVLADAALETGGRYVFVADSAKLGAMYAQIGDELRASATYAIAAHAETGNGTITVKSIGDQLAVPPRVELVLDASGSMKRKAGAGSMMDAAKSVLTDVVTQLPNSATVGLRVYGHRTPEGKPDACHDSELVVPFGNLDRKALTTKIKAVKALGTTPIAYSIEQVGQDLKDVNGPSMLIIVTDGKEECGGDPQAAIAALRKSGIDVSLNIVGFSLTDAGDRDVMTKVAAAGNGQFFDAKGATDLKNAVVQSLAVPYSIVDATGAVVGHGLVGGPAVTAPAGDMSIRLDTASTPVTIDHVVVAPNKATSVQLDKDGDKVGAKISAPGSAL